MSLKLNGATSGSIELDVPDAIGSDVTGVLLPTAAGTLDRLERAGNILQVVNASTDTEVDHLTLAFTDTGLSASITVSGASNQVICIVDQSYMVDGPALNATWGGIRVLRDSVTIHDPLRSTTGPYELGISATNSTSGTRMRNRAHISVVDTPGVGTFTYKTQAQPNATSRPMTTQEGGTSANGSSNIILMEVAG